MAKVEFGHRQLTAVCELAIVVGPGFLPCIAVAQRIRSEEGKLVMKSENGQYRAHVRQVPCAWQ